MADQRPDDRRDSERTAAIGGTLAGGQRSRASIWTAARVLPTTSAVKYRRGLVECESCDLYAARSVRLDHEPGRRRIDRVLRQRQPTTGVFVRSPANGPHVP